MNEESLGPIVGSWLRAVDRPMPAPDLSIGRAMAEVERTPQVRARLGIGVGSARSTVRPGRSMSLIATLVGGAAVVLAGGYLTVLSTPPPVAPGIAQATTPPVASGVDWSTSPVELVADGFSIEANGLVFTTDGATLDIDAPSHGPDYLRLEVTWQEHDREQRFHMGFGSDATHWWVDEIHAYDGRTEGEWAHAYGPFFRTRLGETFVGDVRLELFRDRDGFPPASGQRVIAIVDIDAMRLRATPGSLDDIAVLPPGDRLTPRLNPFRKGEPLHCSGILSLSPAEAHERLLDAGYGVNYRLLVDTPEDFDPRTPPEGIIESAGIDTYGIVNLSVDNRPNPADPLPRCSQGN